MKETVKVLTCNHCKLFYVAPKEQCKCGCSVLSETHPINLMFTEDFKDGLGAYFGGKTNKKTVEK